MVVGDTLSDVRDSKASHLIRLVPGSIASLLPSLIDYMRSAALLVLLALHQLVTTQDGSISSPTTSASAAGYSCDPAKCQLPKCNCASTSPPGGLSPVSWISTA